MKLAAAHQGVQAKAAEASFGLYRCGLPARVVGMQHETNGQAIERQVSHCVVHLVGALVPIGGTEGKRQTSALTGQRCVDNLLVRAVHVAAILLAGQPVGKAAHSTLAGWLCHDRRMPRKPTTPFGHIVFGADGSVQKVMTTLSDTKEQQEKNRAQEFASWLEPCAYASQLPERDHDFLLYLGSDEIEVQLTEAVELEYAPLHP